MGKQYYECHITLNGDPEKLRPVVEKLNWSFSCIHDDIIMGVGLKCYATQHYNSRYKPETIIQIVQDTADAIFLQGFPILRRKVELVIYDDRSSKVKP